MTNYSVIGGFEVGSLLGEPRNAVVTSSTVGSGVTGAVSLEKVIVKTGTYSLKLSPASGATGFWDIQSGGLTFNSPIYIRFYLRITTLPASSRLIFNTPTTNAYNIKINSDGTLGLYKNDTLVGNSSIALTDTTKWYRVELKVTANSQELKIDGNSQVIDTVAAPGSTRIMFGANDTVAATYVAYVDDYALTSDNYPGDGKVVLLTPISDNARSTEWTGGVGGTTNLWKAVSNLPPTGTASETDTTQIEHAGGATGTYEAVMNSYSSAGIPENAVINTVMPFIWHGEDSATGDKLLEFNIKSNPATTSLGPFNVAGVSGALGTWPTGWWIRTSPLGGAPSNLNSPIMVVSRPETASRVASVCFMGIYVDYTPATTIPPSSTSDFIPAKSSQIVSVNRASFY